VLPPGSRSVLLVTDEASMASTGRFRLLRSREGLPHAVRALGLILLAGSLSGFLAAAFPVAQDSPVGLFRLVGVVALVGAALIWWLGARTPQWLLHASVAAGTLMIGLLIARAASAVGMVVTATDYMWMAVYAGFFFSRAAARAHVTLIAITFGVALLINTHWVPVDAWIFMTASLVVASETIARQSSRLRQEAHTDELTGLLNRKGLIVAAERAFSLADRTDMELTIGLIDLDHFKQVNDREGHAAGDGVLIELAKAWMAEIQPGDIFARLGGDEFLVLLVGHDEDESARLLQRLRFTSPSPWSIGVITRRPGEDLRACLARADNALYAAKRSRLVQAGAHPRATAARRKAQLESS
jgi:diguanylate cyclase (GGDEF)-like protein